MGALPAGTALRPTRLISFCDVRAEFGRGSILAGRKYRDSSRRRYGGSPPEELNCIPGAKSARAGFDGSL